MNANFITFIGLSILFIYILLQIFNFYGIGADIYGIYLAFFIFIIISFMILPKYPNL